MDPGRQPTVPAEAIRDLVREAWGFDDLRPLQREAIEASLARRDALVVLPTGRGKSHCYQTPAPLEPGLTVVVSPLISLIKDQVDRLAARGIASAFLNSSLDAGERRRVEVSVANGTVRILYVAPGRFGEGAFRRLLWRRSYGHLQSKRLTASVSGAMTSGIMPSSASSGDFYGFSESKAAKRCRMAGEGCFPRWWTT
ncbi:MAG: DEAD/DEAH box helicase [Planctomycetes bacterium]|nr:DEAD/DEAH box helicase [Planctomycetota bacterium]